MKKFLIGIYCFFNVLIGYAQLDVKHYVPPLYGRTNVQNHYMILSTPSAAPVNVDVKNGQGTILFSVVITDVAPSTTLLGVGYAADGIIDTPELNTVNPTDGFIIEASAPIYVNLRHVQNAQGLSLNSKGASTGLGTRFRSGHIYNSAALPHVKASEISVMASEDNTTVTFSDIKPNVVFRGTPTTAGTSNDIVVNLNAGESYTIAAWLDEPGATGNVNDVNGTLITSTKPIAVNTGSWLGGADGNLRDIGVDQIVPADLIGTQYIFVEGDGNANTERPLIVADYNNTDVFVNGNPVPVATLNSGDYFYLPQTAYSANDNIYVETSEPVFMYQSLSGASPAATSLNFIPPLRCNGFKKVVIPSVNLVGVPTVSITARANASVYVNGSATPLAGGLTVPGNSCWLTYKIPGGVGDFVVESDSIINVALLTLQGPRGSAGYFTGFAQFTQIDQGDTSSFIVCEDQASSFVTYNIDGPFFNISTNFHDPSLGGSVTIDGFNADSLFFTYSRNPGTTGPDTLDLTVCKLLDCCGATPDTICETSTLVFTNINVINTGIGDSISACADTANIFIDNILLGNPDPGYWEDTDNTGALFGDSINTALLGPGTYHFTYFVNGGSICFDSTIATVHIQPMSTSECCSIDPNFVLADPTCFGFTDGSMVITDQYATDYSLDGGTTTQGTGNFPGIGANNYNVNLSFGPDCFYDTVIVINEPAQLAATFLIDSVTCNGACDGQIQANTSGGTLPYTFSLGGAPGQAADTYSNLCAGPATITITDANNCQEVYPNTIFEPAVLTIAEDVVVDETCTLGNGSLSVNANGGTVAYSYTLDGGTPQASPSFTNLSAGTYTIEVTDFHGCTASIDIDIIDHLAPNPFVDVLNNVTCAGGLNGSVTIGVNDGTAPFQYSLNGGANQPGNTFPSVSAGNHTVTVTDANGCTGSVTFDIVQPTALNYGTVVTHVSCFGLCDAQIVVNAAGATPPYSYSSDNGLTFSPINTLDNICAGNTNLVVQDANGCFANSIENITEPPALTSIQGFVDPICYQTPTGEISFAPAGGTPGYQFSVDNGTTFLPASPVQNLMAGVYNVIVEDANGCQFTDQVTLTDPPAFTFTFLANNPSNCGANDGSFEITATGGLAPYFYSIDGGVTQQINNGLFTGLFSGLYNLEVQDANGCIDSTYSPLSDNVMTTQTDLTIDVTCYNGSDGLAIISQNNGLAPYSYTFNTNTTSQPNGVFPGLSAGVHYVTVEDAGLCIAIEQFEIFEPDTITFDNTQINITCPGGNDGQIDFTNVLGGDGGPYTYSIDGGVNFFAANSFPGLNSGIYQLQVMDGNGCLGGGQVTLTEPPAFTAFINASDLTCNNDNTGFIQVVAGGATSPYMYTVVGNNGTGIFPTLPAGVYPVTITDVNGCTFDTTQTLTEPAVLAIANNLTNPLCFGSTDGQIEVIAAGGTLPYLFSEDAGVTLQSSNILDNLGDGCFDVYVQDANGCNIQVNECLVEPSELTMAFATNNATCGLDNATLSIAAANGSPGYSYSVDNGISFQAGNNFNGLAPTTITVVLQDNNGCQIDSTITLIADPQPDIDNVATTNPLCYGGNEGTITISSSNGVGVHQYSITSAAGPYQGANNFVGLIDGSYTAYVQDNNGCVDSITVVIVEPGLMDLTITPTDLTCFENLTGEIDIVVSSGGTSPFLFSIDNGVSFQGSGGFIGLAAADYPIVVEDANGCQVTANQLVNEPTPITFVPFDIDSTSCFGFCDGAVSPNAVGGTVAAGYTYSWSGGIAGPADATAINVCAGIYSVIVTDDNGCTNDSLNFVVYEPILATIDSALTTPVTCFGDSDGEIDVYSVNAGFYSIGGPFTVATNYNGLLSDSYTVHVQDINGCPGDSLQVFVGTPQPLNGFVTPDVYICQGDSIFFSIVATGGTQPYNFLVNQGGGNNANSAIIFEPIFSDTVYYVEITDANGCQFETDTMVVTVAPPPILITSNDTTICPGELVTLSSEATDLLETYTYLWSSGETGPFIYPNVTSDTTFYVDVTDECNVTTIDSIHVDLFQDPVITLIPDVLGGCPPFQVNYTIGVNLADLSSDLIWTTNFGTIDSSNFNNIYVTYSNPGTGVLDVSFTSSNGCQVDTTFSNLIDVYGLPTAQFTVNPSQPTIYDSNVQLVNTSLNYTTNEWFLLGDTLTTTDTGINLTTAPTDSSIAVCLVAFNEFGCSDTTCSNIDIINDLFLFVPNTIILDGWSDNAVFKPVTNYFHPDYYHMYIFNRWGELLFETEDVDGSWDGTYNGVIVPDGVYVWKITGAPYNNEADLKEFHGHVTVLK